MTVKINHLRIGTRKSPLALWQSNFIKKALERSHSGLKVTLLEIDTKGDLTQSANLPLPEIGGKGLFTAELEEALRRGDIDLAVHSLKDLPTAEEQEFAVLAVPIRGPVEDVLITRGEISFWELPDGALIGTSSLRRSAQLLRLRSDIRTRSIRGNVDTRISKVVDRKEFDAAVLAQAGLERLGRINQGAYIFPVDELMPAAGQGALAVQGLRARVELNDLLKALHHQETEECVNCERAFLNALGGGCNVPVGAHARVQGRSLNFMGRCLSLDGGRCVDVSGTAAASSAEDLGKRMAEKALKDGAEQILAALAD